MDTLMFNTQGAINQAKVDAAINAYDDLIADYTAKDAGKKRTQYQKAIAVARYKKAQLALEAEQQGCNSKLFEKVPEKKKLTPDQIFQGFLFAAAFLVALGCIVLGLR